MTKRVGRYGLVLALALHGGIVLAAPVRAAEDARPNVLFIAVDDMNDWTSVLNGYEGEVHTPNIERLAKRGVSFVNAQTASPLCCPSRAAIMLGKRPSTTGIYNNGQWWRPHMPHAVSLPMAFRAHGYTAVGAGKIYHHTAGNNHPISGMAFSDWFSGMIHGFGATRSTTRGSPRLPAERIRGTNAIKPLGSERKVLS